MSAPPNTLIKQDNDSLYMLYTPSGPSSLTSARGALHYKSSKESIQSSQTSLSNFSTHDAPSAVYKDRDDLSVSDFNHSHTLQKSIFSLQNESQSTVSVTPGVEPDRRSRVGTHDNVDESLAHRHPGIRCYHCQQEIVGARFRCVDCTTIGIDLCWNCEIAGFPGDLDASDDGHNSSHAMLKTCVSSHRPCPRLRPRPCPRLRPRPCPRLCPRPCPRLRPRPRPRSASFRMGLST
ncbi:hypothetical protein BC826DRAFT_299080 [Russula brevipes]|nr:hypothetical protein BC826DRAFT_299080 [Russula brevipes]